MVSDSKSRNIQSREQLFDFLQSQMQTAYRGLREEQRLAYESSLIKSYIFEVDLPERLHESGDHGKNFRDFLRDLFGLERGNAQVIVAEKEEDGFFEIRLSVDGQNLIVYVDTITNPRFWLGFSISGSQKLDWWFENITQSRSEFDLVWLWPSFLEQIQRRGTPRGFGLDYDYRKFEVEDTDRTTYLKMQLWGGRETQELYRLLKTNERFQDKIVLSKVRLKESGGSESEDLFALQDVKYTGKFTTRGTDFSTHVATLGFVRSYYAERIQAIEDKYGLRWREGETSGVTLDGFAINFIPEGFEIPVIEFCKKVLDGTSPFRLLGFPSRINDTSVVADVVDFHTGGALSLEIYPDMMSVYIPQATCGNSIARLYTNLQHYFNVRFKVESDNGDTLF